jgi:hypothetical protein
MGFWPDTLELLHGLLHQQLNLLFQVKALLIFALQYCTYQILYLKARLG